MSRRYRINANYNVASELEVVVKDGGDPNDPADWESIESEFDTDCHLADVLTATEIDEQGRDV